MRKAMSHGCENGRVRDNNSSMAVHRPVTPGRGKWSGGRDKGSERGEEGPAGARERRRTVREVVERRGRTRMSPVTGRSGCSVVRRAQHPQMAPACDLHRVHRPCAASATGSGGALLRPGRLAHGVGERLQVVTTGAGGSRGVGEPDDLPAARRGEALGVLGAQVVAVGFGVGGERTEDRGRVGVDVRQRRDGGTAASGSRTATYRAHDVGRYRTLERAATTLPQVTPPCRAVRPSPGVRGPAVLTWGDIGSGHTGPI